MSKGVYFIPNIYSDDYADEIQYWENDLEFKLLLERGFLFKNKEDAKRKCIEMIKFKNEEMDKNEKGNNSF